MEGVNIPRTETMYQTLQDLGIDRSSVFALATFVGQLAEFHPIFTDEGMKVLAKFCHSIAIFKVIHFVYHCV